MFRFTLSTCGVLSEVAMLDSTAPTTAIVLGATGVALAVALWWTDLRPMIDHLIGADL